MKKVTTIILLAVLTVSIAVMLFACNTTITDDIKLVDGYYVYRIMENSSYKNCYALFGVQDDKIINGALTIPEEINGTRVSALGFKELGWVGEREPLHMYKNDKIRKIVINHEIMIYDTLFVNLKELKELQCNAKVSFYYYQKNINELLSVKLIDKESNSNTILSEIKNLRSVKLVNNKGDLSRFLSPKDIVAYFMPNAEQLTGQTLSQYTSLSSFIIPETVMKIDKGIFTNSEVDVFVRHTKENCPEGLKNGWDEGVNVVWGFEDEIVVFDTFDGSAIQCSGTNKNYQIAKIGEKLQEPAQPTKEGYTFTGWYKDYALSEQWNFDTDLVEESTVLVAGWQKNN